MSLSIRELVDIDLKPAEKLLNITFKSDINRLDDLRLYRRMQPDGWFGAFDDGHFVGMVGAVNYDGYAHIGFMVVKPEMQGRGIGRALMEFLLNWLDRQKVQIITLDASKMGYPLYEKLGFVEYSQTIVLERQCNTSTTAVTPPHISLIKHSDIDELVDIDTTIFGANRRKVFLALLETYPTRGLVQRDANGKIAGYLYALENRIGPWIMLQPEKTEELLRAALAMPFDKAISVYLPIENQATVELLKRYGFLQIRINAHMIRGSGETPGQRQKIYSQTSLAVG